MWKERGDDHIYTGPVWDNEWSFDNDGLVYPGNKRQDWTYPSRDDTSWEIFLRRILSDVNAIDRLQVIWSELRDNHVFDKESMENWVDSLRRQVSASARLNHIRWPYLFIKIVFNPVVWGSWDAEVDVVRDYVGDRVAWLDKKLNYKVLASKDGVYQINTPRDLVTFGKMVQEGATNIDAVLLADLDMTNYKDIFEPIGTPDNIFSGNFDGQRHTIKNLEVNGSSYVGLFSVVGGDANISNLTIDSTCKFTGPVCGSFVGAVRGGQPLTLTSCGNEGSVISTGTYAGGLVGDASDGKVNIVNCFNVGPVQATSYAGSLIGYANIANVSNSYNAGSVSCMEGVMFVNGKDVTLTNCYDTQSDDAIRISANQVVSGELCWMLNERSGTHRWRQNLEMGNSVDGYPILHNIHAIVYQGEDSYTNNSSIKDFRYYKFEITGVQSGDSVQFSEFGLLDSKYNEYKGVYVYAGSEGDFSHENWPNAADQDLYTKYCSSLNGRTYFLLDAGSEIGLYGYRIYTANDSQIFSGRNPASWALFGSNIYLDDPDDMGWILIDEQKNYAGIAATNYTPYDFYVHYHTDGIKNKVTENKSVPAAIYDLQGRRVSRLSKGRKKVMK